MSLSIKDLHEKYSIKDLYQFTLGDNNIEGVFGYKVPKQCEYIDIEYSFPKEKRHDAMTDALKKSKDPDPTKYATNIENFLKKNQSLGGLFSKSKKETVTDLIIKKSLQTPGPGKYLETSETSKNRMFFGKFE